MTIKELYIGLKSLGYPVAYRKFVQTPTAPFIVYFEEGSDNFAADGTAYVKISALKIELYCDNKDLEAESKIESWLDSNGFYWEKDTTYIDSEKYEETIYSFEN